jgi:hypothetical protein
MRLFIAAVVLSCIAPLQACAATYTSVRHGMWSDPQTWGGMGVPRMNDNAVIRHSVVVDTDTIVGTSPSSDKLSAAAAIHISNTNGTSDRGELTVAAGVTLRALGDIRMESSNRGDFHALYLMGAGSRLIFDSSAASDPSGPHYRIYTSNPPNQNYRSSNVRILGTKQYPVRFQGVTRGRIADNQAANNHMFIEQRNSGSSRYGLMDVIVRHAEIEDCGFQQSGCLVHAAEAGAQFVLEHVTMRRTSGIKPAYHAQSSPTATSTFILRDVKTFETTTDPASRGYIYRQSAGSLYVNTGTRAASGRRLIEDCYFDKGMAYPALLADFTMRTTVWDRYPPAANGADGVIDLQRSAALIEDNVYRALDVQARGLLARTVEGLYFYGDGRPSSPRNPHGISVGIKGDVSVDRFIFDYGQATADPNGIFSQPYPAGDAQWTYQHSYTNMLMLPTSESLDSISMSSPLGSMILPRLFPRIRWEHNTFMYAGRSYAQTNYLLEAGCPQPGSGASYKSNLAWGIPPSTNFAWTLHTGDPSCPVQQAPADIIEPSGISHNACFNCSLSQEGYWRRWQEQHPGRRLTNIGTPYNIPTTGATPGLSDLPITADPHFVDIRRNLKTWCDEKKGLARGSCAPDDAMEYLATGPGAIAERIADLSDWVRGGFVPQNEAYRGAGHDGTDIGAVPMPRVNRAVRRDAPRRRPATKMD